MIRQLSTSRSIECTPYVYVYVWSIDRLTTPFIHSHEHAYAFI